MSSVRGGKPKSKKKKKVSKGSSTAKKTTKKTPRKSPKSSPRKSPRKSPKSSPRETDKKKGAKDTEHNWRDRVRLVLECWLRKIFGVKIFKRCGHFLNADMNPMIQDYCREVIILEVKKGRINWIGPEKFILCATTGDGCLYTAGQKWITEWDWTGDIIKVWTPHLDRINCLHYSQGLLASGSDDGEIVIWYCRTHRFHRILKAYGAGVSCLKMDDLAENVIAGYKDGSVRWWIVKSGTCQKMWKHNLRPVTTVSFFPMKLDSIITGSGDGSLCEWNLRSDEVVRCIEHSTIKNRFKFAINRDATLIAVALSDCIMIYPWPEMDLSVGSMRMSAMSMTFSNSNANMLFVAENESYRKFVVKMNVQTQRMAKIYEYPKDRGLSGRSGTFIINLADSVFSVFRNREIVEWDELTSSPNPMNTWEPSPKSSSESSSDSSSMSFWDCSP